MQGTPILLLSLAYLLPLVLVALLLTAEHRRPRRVITLVLAVLPLFYIGHYLLLMNMRGLPSDAPVPAHFQLLAFQVSEPESRTGRAGEILLWLRDQAAPQPRVHRLAYDKQLHEALVEAGRRQAEGRAQMGTRLGDQRSERAGSPSERPGSITFEDDRKPQLPAKDTDGRDTRH